MYVARLIKSCWFLLAMLMPAAASAAAGPDITLASPNQRIEVRIRAGGGIRYDVLVNGAPVLRDSTASITVDRAALGREAQVREVGRESVDHVLEPAVRQKSAAIRERYNQLRLDAGGGLAAVFRAYDEGVAYRLETSLSAPLVTVDGEEAAFHFAGDYTVYYPQEESFFSHNERKYTPRKLSAIAPKAMATLPAVVDANGVKIAIAESDVEDYPGLWLRGTGGPGLEAVFPPYPLKEALQRDRDVRVAEPAGYIARTAGTRNYPWRVLAIAEKDGDLITNSLVWLLAKPSQVADPSWIKPGKVAWDWWNAKTSTAWTSKAASTPRPTNTTSILRRNTGSSTSSWTKAGTSSATYSTRCRRSTSRRSWLTGGRRMSASSCGWFGRRWPINSSPRSISSPGGA
jgi:alpha-glucosidase